MLKAAASTFDPRAYAGPLRRADGKCAYNHHFWPLEGDAWRVTDPSNPRGLQYSGIWPHWIFVIALEDGRWSTAGATYEIDENRDCYGRPCVFDSREKAIRYGVARFIRRCRAARYWSGTRISHERCQLAVNWALNIARRPPVKLPPPIPKPQKTGLPLFDLEVANG